MFERDKVLVMMLSNQLFSTSLVCVIALVVLGCSTQRSLQSSRDRGWYEDVPSESKDVHADSVLFVFEAYDGETMSALLHVNFRRISDGNLSPISYRRKLQYIEPNIIQIRYGKDEMPRYFVVHGDPYYYSLRINTSNVKTNQVKYILYLVENKIAGRI